MNNLSIDPNLLSTLTSFPSSLEGSPLNFDLLKTLAPEISSKFQNIFENLNSSPLLSALNNLSGVPMHPYDQLKYNVYGPEYKDIKFKTLEDVPLPETYQTGEVLQAVTTKIQSMQKTLLENVDRPPHLFTNTILNTVSGEQIIPNMDMYKKHIEFTELLRNIPVSKLTDQQVYDYAKKIVAEFVKTY